MNAETELTEPWLRGGPFEIFSSYLGMVLVYLFPFKNGIFRSPSKVDTFRGPTVDIRQSTVGPRIFSNIVKSLTCREFPGLHDGVSILSLRVREGGLISILRLSEFPEIFPKNCPPLPLSPSLFPPLLSFSSLLFPSSPFFLPLLFFFLRSWGGAPFGGPGGAKILGGPLRGPHF